MEIRTIPIDQLHENPWNPNCLTGFKYKALVKNMSKEGNLQPLLVRPFEGKFQIIDGAHRKKSAEQAGIKEIDCVVVDWPEEKAKAFSISMNNIRGKPDDLLLADVLRDLSQSYSTDQLKELVAFNEREQAYFLKLLEQPQDFTSAIELKNELPITLTFIVSEKEAEIIDRALVKINPENKSKALVKLCLENLNGAE